MQEQKTTKMPPVPPKAKAEARLIIKRARQHYASQRGEGEKSWEEMDEMQRWLWIGAYISRASGLKVV